MSLSNYISLSTKENGIAVIGLLLFINEIDSMNTSQIANKEKVFRTLTERILCGLICLNRDGEILWMSEATGKNLAIDTVDSIGAKLHLTFVDYNFIHLLNRLYSSPEMYRGQSFNLKFKTQNGHVYTYCTFDVLPEENNTAYLLIKEIFETHENAEYQFFRGQLRLELNENYYVTSVNRSRVGIKVGDNLLYYLDDEAKQLFDSTLSYVFRTNKNTFIETRLQYSGSTFHVGIQIKKVDDSLLSLLIHDLRNEKRLEKDRTLLSKSHEIAAKILEQDITGVSVSDLIVSSIKHITEIDIFKNSAEIITIFWDNDDNIYQYNKNMDDESITKFSLHGLSDSHFLEKKSYPSHFENILLEKSFNNVVNQFIKDEFYIFSIIINSSERGFIAFKSLSRNFTEIELDIIHTLASTFTKVIREKLTSIERNKANRFLNAIVNNSSEVTLVVNKSGIIQYVTPALTRILGYNSQDVIGNSVFNFIHESDKEKALKGFENRLNQGGFGIPETYKLLDKNGSVKYLKTITSNCIDDSAIQGLVINAQDITEQIISEKEKLLAIYNTEERERRRIARDLHDGVGQSIAAANMYFNTLESEIAPILNKELYELYTLGRMILNRAAQETREVSHNIMPPSIKRFGLQFAINDLMSEYKTLFSNVEFYWDTSSLSDKPQDVEIELAIYRMIQELISNVVKHSEATNVQVEIKESIENYTLRVKDNGKGMNNADAFILNNNGIGVTSLIQRIDALNACLNVCTKEGEGLEVIIEINKKKQVCQNECAKCINRR